MHNSPQKIPQRFTNVLRDMRRKVRVDPLLPLANGPLLEEMRRPLKGAPGGRPKMDLLATSGLVGGTELPTDRCPRKTKHGPNRRT